MLVVYLALTGTKLVEQRQLHNSFSQQQESSARVVVGIASVRGRRSSCVWSR